MGDREGYVNYFRRVSTSGELTSEGRLTSGSGRPLDVGHNSAPVVFDWNDDGLPDLIVGKQEGPPGSVLLYLNQGTPGNPVLVDSTFVLSSGEPICLYNCVPHMADLDGDGLEDLVVGECTGKVYCFENVGSVGEPLFEGCTPLESDSSVIQDSWESRPAIDDWNEDGYADLLVGEYWGMVFLYLAYPTGIHGEAEAPGEGPVMTIAPSPASSDASVRVDLAPARGAGPGHGNLEVFSADGRLVWWTDLSLDGSSGGTITLDCGPLGSGTFLVRAVLPSGPGGQTSGISRKLVVLP